MNHGMYEIISRKRDGGELQREEIEFVVSGYVRGTVTDYQMSALLMAIYIRGMSRRELGDLTYAMMHSGAAISLAGSTRRNIDKHSTGGVGDKISFVVCPLVAACGVNVPMLSGRGLGHTGGTLDKLESIPGMQVFLTEQRFREVLAQCGMAICGQTDNIVPADKKIYALRDATATVSSLPLIASSIMSKKLALGSDGVVMDVKTGSGAFMRAMEDSVALCRTMVELGAAVGKPVSGLVTDMDRPLGRAVGNALEMIESIECLKGRGPDDVMEVTLGLGVQMLRLAGAESDKRAARERLQRALADGSALRVLRRFIELQGGDARVCDDYAIFPTAKLQEDLVAWQDGVITAVDAFAVGMAAIDVGAGRRRKEDAVNPATGFVFQRNRGDRVRAGEPLVTIHADDPAALQTVGERLRQAIRIEEREVPAVPMIHYEIDASGVRPWSW